jgi:hypothetical protein
MSHTKNYFKIYYHKNINKIRLYERLRMRQWRMINIYIPRMQKELEKQQKEIPYFDPII